MKKILRPVLLAVLAAGVFAVSAKADPFADFNTYVGASKVQAEARLAPFVEDLGGVIGGNDFNSGRNIGFPGFDVGIAATVQAKPNDNNSILNDSDVNAFGVPLVRASVALPVIDADLTLRGLTLSGFSIIGAGVSYNVLKSGTVTKFIPDVSVSAFYDVINYDYFKGSHMSLNAVASFDIPVIKPFIGVGLDRTTLKVQDVPGAVGTLVNGAEATISKPRYTLGVRFSPLPLLYVYGAYSSLHGQPGYNGGLGVKF
ncbi:MAG TPA: hypothetical protein DCZ92_02435 [Elusimicrobia bacterium]|nr:MAG: hypothetical protein A2016_00325 [Elusimicrobia bacterium GWF2_62_30]HBA59682.1 hypothetical protein [Elusimicrobiota bacterium]